MSGDQRRYVLEPRLAFVNTVSARGAIEKEAVPVVVGFATAATKVDLSVPEAPLVLMEVNTPP